jgi:hypothetical protein
VSRIVYLASESAIYNDNGDSLQDGAVPMDVEKDERMNEAAYNINARQTGLSTRTKRCLIHCYQTLSKCQYLCSVFVLRNTVHTLVCGTSILARWMSS